MTSISILTRKYSLERYKILVKLPWINNAVDGIKKKNPFLINVDSAVIIFDVYFRPAFQINKLQLIVVHLRNHYIYYNRTYSISVF